MKFLFLCWRMFGGCSVLLFYGCWVFLVFFLAWTVKEFFFCFLFIEHFIFLAPVCQRNELALISNNIEGNSVQNYSSRTLVEIVLLNVIHEDISLVY